MERVSRSNLTIKRPSALPAFSRAKARCSPGRFRLLPDSPGSKDGLDDLQVVQAGVGRHLGRLGVQTDPSLRLLHGRNPRVGNDSHRCTSWVASSPIQHTIRQAHITRYVSETVRLWTGPVLLCRLCGPRVTACKRCNRRHLGGQETWRSGVFEIGPHDAQEGPWKPATAASPPAVTSIASRRIGPPRGPLRPQDNLQEAMFKDPSPDGPTPSVRPLRCCRPRPLASIHDHP